MHPIPCQDQVLDEAASGNWELVARDGLRVVHLGEWATYGPAPAVLSRARRGPGPCSPYVLIAGGEDRARLGKRAPRVKKGATGVYSLFSHVSESSQIGENVSHASSQGARITLCTKMVPRRA